MTASAYAMATFSAVAEIISDVYSIDSLWVNFCVTVFLLSFAFLNFFSIYIMEKFGL
jgi:hypothetical protein